MKRISATIFVVSLILFPAFPADAALDPACVDKGKVQFDLDKPSARRVEKITFSVNFRWNKDAPDICKITPLIIRLKVKTVGPGIIMKEYKVEKAPIDPASPVSFQHVTTPEDIYISRESIPDPYYNELGFNTQAEVINMNSKNGIAGSSEILLKVLPPPADNTPVGYINRRNTSLIQKCFPRFDVCKNTTANDFGGNVCAETSRCMGQEGTPAPAPTMDGSVSGNSGQGGGSKTDTKSTTVTEEFGPPFDNKDFQVTFDSILDWLLRIAIPVGVLMILISGVLMISSEGNPTRFNNAKNMLLYTIIGLAIILIGKGFIALVESLINL